MQASKLDVGYERPRHPDRHVAKGIEVDLNPGDFICLLGPNGSGKSTLLRTLCGLLPPLTGEVRLEGVLMSCLSPRETAKRLSMVFTQRPAVGMMSVADLVAMGRYPYTDWTGRLGLDDKKAVARAMADVGVASLARRPMRELSDGERQKVMIARALAQEPRIMLLDEPTAFLDLPRRVELMSLLRDLAHESGRAVLLSTHDLDLALRCADRLWLLAPGGSLTQGAPEDMVLDGSVERIFKTPLAEFDSLSGSFRLDRPGKNGVTVSGEGLCKVWTEKALTRCGFNVRDQGPARTVVEAPAEPGLPWRIRGRSGSFPSLEVLLACMRSPGEFFDG
jgi:iron complex transport system ATP-binding protein